MDEVNPIYIPRNHLVEKSIREGHAGRFDYFNRLKKTLSQPFVLQSEGSEFEEPATPEERVDRTFCGT